MCVRGSLHYETLLLFAGADVEAEGKDRQSLDLPGHQSDLLKDAYTYGETSYTPLFSL